MEARTVILGGIIVGIKQEPGEYWLKTQRAPEAPLITSLCLSFFICKMGVALPPRMKDEYKYKVLSTR